MSAMTDADIPPLTDRAKARLAAGRTEGAGTDVCVKCMEAKEPKRINSDKCGACNRGPGAATTARSRPGRSEVTKSRVAHPVFPEATYLVMVEQAHERGLTIEDYIIEGMRRVLKRDLRDSPIDLARMFPDE